LDSLESTGRHAGAAFRFRWTFQRDELREAVESRVTSKGALRVARVLFLVALVALAIRFAVHPTWSGGAWLILGPAGLFLLKALPGLQVRQQWRANPLLRHEVEFTVSAAGVRVRTPTTTTDYSWEVFQKVDETDRFFLLSFSPRAASPFLLLPKGALRNQLELAMLRDLLHRKVGER
jgi:hypothetical protein